MQVLSSLTFYQEDMLKYSEILKTGVDESS